MNIGPPVCDADCVDEIRYRVLPGKPDEHYLVHKLNNLDLCSGSQMPPSMLLGMTDRVLVSRWICGGAPEN